MLEMETFAIAARLHVVMRRVLGRVTDVDWMTRNRDYAREMIRLARGHTDAELLSLADKFEAILASQSSAEPAPLRVLPQASKESRMRRETTGGPAAHDLAPASRYVGRLR